MGGLLPLGPNAILTGYPTPCPASSLAVPDGLEIFWGLDVGNVNLVTSRVIGLDPKRSVGVLTGIVTADRAVGQVGHALTFASGKFITQSTNGTYLPVWSVCAWINSTSLAGEQDIIYKGSNTDKNYCIQVQGTSGIILVGFTSATSAYREVTSATAITINNWWFVCGTFDGAVLRVYMNGILNASSAQAFTPQDVAIAPTVGTLGLFNIFNFVGRINEPRVYNRALGAGEVLELYVTGKAGLRTKMFGLDQWDASTMFVEAPAPTVQPREVGAIQKRQISYYPGDWYPSS